MAVGSPVFDDARAKLMGETSVAVYRKLQGTDYPDTVREAIAGRIVEIGRRSRESDPERLANVVVESLGIKL